MGDRLDGVVRRWALGANRDMALSSEWKGSVFESSNVIYFKTVWPSGLRRWLKAPVRKGVGSNPTGVILHEPARRTSEKTPEAQQEPARARETNQQARNSKEAKRGTGEREQDSRPIDNQQQTGNTPAGHQETKAAATGKQQEMKHSRSGHQHTTYVIPVSRRTPLTNSMGADNVTERLR